MSYAKVVQRNGLVYRRVWRGSLLFSFLNPLLFLTAMGLGLGAVVNRQNPEAFGGVSYLMFFATGMLPATCMNAATFECAWPIHSKFVWTKNYEAMLATPLRILDLYLGEIVWLTLRLFMIAVPFFGVMWAFDVVSSGQSLLAIPVAVLTGLGFGGGVIAFSATIDRDDSFNGLFRFVITPLFLFSGTFFPLEIAPSWIQGIANATPLYHGIQLVRDLSLYEVAWPEAVWHLAYLVGFLFLTSAFALRQYRKKLVY